MIKPIVRDPICRRRRLDAEIITLCVHRYITYRLSYRYLLPMMAERGNTLDSLLRPERGIAAAQAFPRKVLSTSLPRWPRKITLDGYGQNHLALRFSRRKDPK